MKDLDFPEAAASPRPGLPSRPDGEPALPSYSLPVVATALAAGILLTTRPGRDVTRGLLRTGLLLVKPALLVGGILKLRDLAGRSHPQPSPPPTLTHL